MSSFAPHAQFAPFRHRIIGAMVGCGGPSPNTALAPNAVAHPRSFVRVEPPDDVATSIDRIAGASNRIAHEVERSIVDGARAVVLGGDHSIAIGTWKGLARAFRPNRFGLVWLDAHLDAHVPSTSPTGNVHGMPVAVLLGEGDLRLVGVGRAGRVVDPSRLVIVGARSYEPAEASLLSSFGVRVIGMDEVRRRGFLRCVAEAVSIASSEGAPFGVSVDLDVIDPEIAPGVATPVPFGVSARAVADALRFASANGRCAAIEIAELDASRDRHGRTVALARSLLEIACSRGGLE